MIGFIGVKLLSEKLKGRAELAAHVVDRHLPDLAQAVLGQGVDGPYPVPVLGGLVICDLLEDDYPLIETAAEALSESRRGPAWATPVAGIPDL